MRKKSAFAFLNDLTTLFLNMVKRPLLRVDLFLFAIFKAWSENLEFYNVCIYPGYSVFVLFVLNFICEFFNSSLKCF